MLQENVQNTRLAIIAIILGILFQVGWFVMRFAYTMYDDAFIYMRFAENFIAGCGIRYNCGGNAVEGITSLLFLGLVSAGHFTGFHDDINTWLQLLGLLGVSGSISAAAVCAWRLAPGRWAILLPLGVALVLAFDHFFLVNSVIGLETGFGCLFVTLVVWSRIQPHWPLQRTLLVLAFLTRPESALLILTLPLHRRVWKVRFLLPLLAALAAIVACRWFYFHDIMPNTFWAKSGGTFRHVALGWDYIIKAVKNFPLTAFAPLALLAVKNRTAIASVLISAFLWLAFFLQSGGDVFEHSRLWAPLVPALTALGLVGLAELATLITNRVGESGARLPAAFTVITATVLALVVSFSHNLEPKHGMQDVRKWIILGKFLKENHPGATVAAVNVGAIGYYSGLDMIDLVGLTTREVAKSGRSVPPSMIKRNWIGHERHNTEWVLSRQPDIIVFNQWSKRPGRLEELKAKYYASWLLLRAVKEGRARYILYSPPIQPGLHPYLLVRLRD